MANQAPTVLILGAGINGAALARELLLSGVGVCLVDTADIASGATAYSSRLIHGGLRYLEYAEFSLVRESLAERERLLRLAPQYVRPLQLAIPIRRRTGGLYSGLKKFVGLPAAAAARGLWVVRAGLTLYDLLARDPQLPRHGVQAIGQATRPAVDVADYRWLCTYWDAQIAYPERFVLALLEDARRLAAESGVAFQVLPYHRAKLKGTTAVIHYVDHDNEPVQRFSPAAIVNATGAWVDATLSQLDVPAKKLMGGTKGSHFVTFNETLARALDGRGVYAEAADGRPVFLLPWGPGGDRGQPPPATLVGTTDEPYAGDPADAVATPAELQYLLDTANEVIPDACLTGEDIDMHYSGVRPLPATDASTPAAITRRHMLVEHPQCALPLISIVGGKLTTCRSLAEEAAAKILARLNMPVVGNSRGRIVPGGEAYPASAADVSAEWDRMAVKSSLSRAQIATLWPLLGTRTGAVLDESGATSAANLPDTDIPRAVVRWMIQNEWVTSLNDLVERRLMLLYNPRLSMECLRDAAELLVDFGRVSSSEANEMVQGTIERLQVHFGKQLRG